MEQLPNGYTLDICPGAFPLSTDSMLLSHFAKLPRNAHVLDLGSGCGTLGLLLCANNRHCHVTGMELDHCAHNAALENIRRNALSPRMESICADLRSLPTEFIGHFDVCISNPPYFSGGPASSTLQNARREDFCRAEDLFFTVSRALKYGGDFYLVHRPERLAELIGLGMKYTMETKRMRLIRHREDKPFSLVLLQFRKGGKPGLILEEAALHSLDNTPTAYYREVYHLD